MFSSLWAGKYFGFEGDLFGVVQDIVGRGLNKLYGLWDELGIDENGRKVDILFLFLVLSIFFGFVNILYGSGSADSEI
jgi:hypothetical protein